MFWVITAVISGLVMLFFMSRRAEEDTDPVWLTVLEVERLGDEIARWEPNLWSLWATAIIENLLFRLEGAEKVLYLNKLEDQIIELQNETYREMPMSEKEVIFLYFEQKTTDLPTH